MNIRASIRLTVVGDIAGCGCSQIYGSALSTLITRTENISKTRSVMSSFTSRMHFHVLKVLLVCLKYVYCAVKV